MSEDVFLFSGEGGTPPVPWSRTHMFGSAVAAGGCPPLLGFIPPVCWFGDVRTYRALGHQWKQLTQSCAPPDQQKFKHGGGALPSSYCSLLPKSAVARQRNTAHALTVYPRRNSTGFPTSHSEETIAGAAYILESSRFRSSTKYVLYRMDWS